MRLARMVTPSAMAAVAACGGSPKPAGLDPAAMLDFKMLTGNVKNVTDAKPICPVIPHFEAELLVSHLSGKLTYQWERSTGKSSETRSVDIPAAAATGPASITLPADEWLQNDRGVQLTPSDKVHVLTPIDRTSQPMVLSAICY